MEWLDDELLALALRDNALDLVKSAVRTRCLLYHIAAYFASPTTLACFGCASLNAFVRPYASSGQSGVDCLSFDRGNGAFILPVDVRCGIRHGLLDRSDTGPVVEF